MVTFKRSALFLLIAVVLLFLLSSPAFAQEPPPPLYVYFERADGNIVMANYGDALDTVDNPGLYEALRVGIINALANFRGVWLQYVEGGPVYIYSNSIRDELTYADFYDDLGLYEVVGDFTPDMALYFDESTGTAVTRNILEFADWIEYQSIWEPFSERWIVEIEINETGMTDDIDKTFDDITQVTIKGKVAKRDDLTAYWRVVLGPEYGETPIPVLEANDVHITFTDGDWWNDFDGDSGSGWPW